MIRVCETTWWNGDDVTNPTFSFKVYRLFSKKTSTQSNQSGMYGTGFTGTGFTGTGFTGTALPYDTLTRYDTVTESLTVEKTLWDFSLVYSFWNKFIHFHGNPLLYILRQLIYTQYTVSLFIQYINSVLWTIIIWMVDWNRILTRRLPNSLIPVT